MYSAKCILFFSICLSCNCDWIEITRRQEKSSSRPRVIKFPRNKYVYTTTSTTPEYENFIYSSLSPSVAPALATKQSVWFAPEEIHSKNITPTTEANSENPTSITMENRMDVMDVTEDVSESMSDAVAVPDIRKDEKLKVWSSGKPGRATIEKVVDGDFKDAKSQTEGFLPFLKRVQDDLIHDSHKNLRGKIDMLKKMRDDMLLNIDERINHLWGRKQTGARHQKDDDYDMHFPSNEGALITIGFLTFAVFLIKLVLKLVHAIKEKENMSAMPTMMTMTGKKKRDTTYSEQNKILQLIENYTPN